VGGDMNHDMPGCPVCSKSSSHLIPVPGWGEMRKCGSCGLVFANPMHLPSLPGSFFSAAYDGDVPANMMDDFCVRARFRSQILANPGRALWFRPHEVALSWLRGNLSPGSRVLEIGFGLGQFLHALRNEGFVPMGLDVASSAAEWARRDGFEVWEGELSTLPLDWPEPAAVVTFFVLHHLTNPVSFLANIRTRWPKAPVLVGEYHIDSSHRVRSLPPRTLSMWTEDAVREALRIAGFTPWVEAFRKAPVEYHIPLSVALLAANLKSIDGGVLSKLYLKVKPVLFFPLAQWDRLRGRYGTLLGIGIPSG